MSNLSGMREILSLEQIPASPAGDQSLLTMLNNDDAELDELAGLIEMNPGLTASIISMSNCAYFAPPQPVYTVIDAMVKVLGLRLVRSMSLAVLMADSLNIGSCSSFSLGRYWHRALSTAQLSQLLAPLVPQGAVLKEAAYLCGLLHEFGILLLVHVFGNKMNDVFVAIEKDTSGQLSTDIESEILGVDHAIAGSLLAQRWQLPEEVATVCADFRHWDYVGDRWKYARTIAVAKSYVKILETSESSVDLELLHTAELELGIDSKRLGGVLEKFSAEFEGIRAIANQLAGGDT